MAKLGTPKANVGAPKGKKIKVGKAGKRVPVSFPAKSAKRKR